MSRMFSELIRGSRRISRDEFASNFGGVAEDVMQMLDGEQARQVVREARGDGTGPPAARWHAAIAEARVWKLQPGARVGARAGGGGGWHARPALAVVLRRAGLVRGRRQFVAPAAHARLHPLLVEPRLPGTEPRQRRAHRPPAARPFQHLAGFLPQLLHGPPWTRDPGTVSV